MIRELIRIFRFGGELLHFRRTLFRSLVPILAAAVILVGVLCGWGLGRVEASAVARAPMFFIDEVEQSNFKQLQDRFARQHQGLLGQLQSQAASGPAGAAR